MARREVLLSYYRRLRMKSPKETLRALAHPGRFAAHVRNIAAGGVREHTNPYRESLSRDEEAAFCADLLSCSVEDVCSAFDEVAADTPFVREVRSRYQEGRPNAESLHIGRFRVWYALVRLARPNVVLETGVHDGLSSALILEALRANGAGHLVSIDLPALDLPGGEPGWLVPTRLRERWTLELGDARRLLPATLERYPAVDIFIHDSDHRREHREFEFRTVRPHAGPGALLMSDDDEERDVLDDLAREWSAKRCWIRCSLVEGDVAHLGGLRLPAEGG
ncbi:MAG TPA: class I SAM-dependent methyltransferase [Dehalococcoidia bacterium]|nr:class I SAM-dependent methyltransferase [Dehalococcoidia bacterium]